MQSVWDVISVILHSIVRSGCSNGVLPRKSFSIQGDVNGRFKYTILSFFEFEPGCIRV